MLASTITDLYDLSIPPIHSITVRDVACSRHSLIIIGWDIFFSYRFDSSEWSDFYYVPSSALLIDAPRQIWRIRHLPKENNDLHHLYSLWNIICRWNNINVS